MDLLGPLRRPDLPDLPDLVDPRCLDRLYRPLPQRGPEGPEAPEAPQAPETNRKPLNPSVITKTETDNIFCMTSVLPFRNCVGPR
jgi:hypothetical protein